MKIKSIKMEKVWGIESFSAQLTDGINLIVEDDFRDKEVMKIVTVLRWILKRESPKHWSKYVADSLFTNLSHIYLDYVLNGTDISLHVFRDGDTNMIKTIFTVNGVEKAESAALYRRYGATDHTFFFNDTVSSSISPRRDLSNGERYDMLYRLDFDENLVYSYLEFINDNITLESFRRIKNSYATCNPVLIIPQSFFPILPQKYDKKVLLDYLGKESQSIVFLYDARKDEYADILRNPEYNTIIVKGDN